MRSGCGGKCSQQFGSQSHDPDFTLGNLHPLGEGAKMVATIAAVWPTHAAARRLGEALFAATGPPAQERHADKAPLAHGEPSPGRGRAVKAASREAGALDKRQP